MGGRDIERGRDVEAGRGGGVEGEWESEGGGLINREKSPLRRGGEMEKGSHWLR